MNSLLDKIIECYDFKLKREKYIKREYIKRNHHQNILFYFY